MRAFQTRRSVRVLPAWLQGLRTRSLATWALLLLVAACGGGNTDAVGVSGTTYTVSATITGLRHSYNGGTLRNNGGDDLKIFNNGTYSFKTALASGSPYAVTVSLQPTGPDQTCTVSNGSGTVGTSNVTNVAIDCPYAAAYSVGGTVTGLVGTGLNLIYDADNVSLRPMATMNADGSFVFDASFTNAINGTVYQVSIVNQPTNPAQTCVVQNGSGTVANADVTGVNVVCGTHTVSLTINGLRQHSAHGIKLQNNGGDDLTRFIDGTYAFVTPVPVGGTYNVTIAAQPQTPDQTCAVTNGSGTIGSSDVSNVVVNCPYPPAFAVGGTITGMTGTGLDLTYFAPNLGVQLGTAAITNTGFVFPASDTSAINGTSYSISVRIQPTNQTCFFTGPGAITGTSFVSGTVGNADVADLNLSCGPVGGVLPCAAPTGVGTTHGSINAAEIWTEAGSPHIIPFDINVSAPVTIQECAVVRIVKGGTVTVTPAGSLVANGGQGRPVTFESKVAGQAWASIRNLGGTLSLNHAVLTGGGDPLSTNPAFAGVLHMQSPSLIGSLHVDNVDIGGSLSQGVYINGPVGFDASSQLLSVHGSAGYPVHVYARVIGSVPSGTYTGNGHDAIAIAGSGPGRRRPDDAQPRRAVPRRQRRRRRAHGRQLAGRRPGCGADDRARCRGPVSARRNAEHRARQRHRRRQGRARRDRLGTAGRHDRLHLGQGSNGCGGRLAGHRLRRRNRSAHDDAEHTGRVRRRNVDHGQQFLSLSGQRHQQRGDPHLRAAAHPVHHAKRNPRQPAPRHRSRLARRPAAGLPGDQHVHRGRRLQGDHAPHVQRRVPRDRAVSVTRKGMPVG